VCKEPYIKVFAHKYRGTQYRAHVVPYRDFAHRVQSTHACMSHNECGGVLCDMSVSSLCEDCVTHRTLFVLSCDRTHACMSHKWRSSV